MRHTEPPAVVLPCRGVRTKIEKGNLTVSTECQDNGYNYRYKRIFCEKFKYSAQRIYSAQRTK